MPYERNTDDNPRLWKACLKRTHIPKSPHPSNETHNVPGPQPLQDDIKAAELGGVCNVYLKMTEGLKARP